MTAEELALLASGDEYELAVIEIQNQVSDAKARLRAEFPHFYEE